MVCMNLARPERRRPKTLSPRRLRRERQELGREPGAGRRDPLAIVDAARPSTRAQCRSGPRPCLFVSCRFHLYLDVNELTGAMKLNFPHLQPWELAESCALDIAERGGMSLEELGALLNVTRERARQIELTAIGKLKHGI